jgi:hypothetical protein
MRLIACCHLSGHGVKTRVPPKLLAEVLLLSSRGGEGNVLAIQERDRLV